MNNIYVTFEKGQENRTSKEYGPFPFVQITYSWLRTGPYGNDFAYCNDGEWIIIGTPDTQWSDVIIYSKP